MKDRVFTGTSAGSLNTAFCATRSYDAANSRLELEAMWEDFHVPAYHGNVVKNSLLKLIKEWTMPRSRRPSTRRPTATVTSLAVWHSRRPATSLLKRTLNAALPCCIT